MLGFAGFLRINELLNVMLKHIKIQESHLEIAISKLKTDQHREGYVVYISRIKSEYCPVKIRILYISQYLEMYLQKAKVDVSNDKESPLICRIFKTKQVIKFQRQRGFHIVELGTFLKVTYQRLQRHPRVLVYTGLDQLVHQQQLITASQID